jgi:hypothetical protein
LALLGGLVGGVLLHVLLLGILLLRIILPSLIPATKTSDQAAHSGARRCALTGIAGDCAPYGSKCSTAACTAQDMPLCGLIWI